MGGRLGKNKPNTNDPFYRPVPPVGPGQPAVDPAIGLGAYDPYEEYGYEPVPTSPLGNYGGPIKRQDNPYGGRYAPGFNQVSGTGPWNYGNYYLGNTTIQMMPMMLNKVHKYGQMQAMAALGNAGLLGSAPMMPSMPSMPIMPCCIPPSFNMSMAAAATPLPVAFNPLVQGMYPMASMNPVNWMTPASFMSALATGPMPYRPPAFDFPNNVGMVMTVPYGTPNPLFSAPYSGSFNSSYNFGGGSSWGCCYSMPQTTLPPTAPPSYYPQPVPVPQPYPVPYAVPVAVPSVQQVPAPQPVAGGCTNACFGQHAVMASNQNLTTQIPINNQPVSGSLPVYNATDQSQNLIGQRIIPSLPSIGSNNYQLSSITPSAAKNTNQFIPNRDTLSDRFRRYLPSIPSLSRSNYNLVTSQQRSEPVLPPILHGQLISDSGWLPKTSIRPSMPSILSSKKRKRLLYTTDVVKPILNSSVSPASFVPHRRRKRSDSSTSEYDCAICQQQREKRRLRERYGSSTVSSLVSSPKNTRKDTFSPNESTFSSKSHTPNSFKRISYKSHRRHPTKIKIKSKSPSPQKSDSPVLLRQSPIQEPRFNGTIHEEEEEDEIEERAEKRSTNDNDSVTEKSSHYESKISLSSIDE